MNKKPLAWSFSSLGTFESCPRMWQSKYVDKTYKEPPQAHLEHGIRVHSALEHRVKDGTPLPEDLIQHEKYVQAFNAFPAKAVLTEVKLGLTKDFKPCEFFAKDVWWRGVVDIALLNDKKAWVGDYKGLALDTKLPTPTGWTTMGEVQVGDTLYSGSGKPCKVVGKSQVKNIGCFKITFDDTTTVVCDEEHLWITERGVLGVQDLLHTGNRKKNRADAVAVAAPIECPDVELPIDPYVLGLWLADGKHTSGEIGKPDQFVWDEIQRRGYEVGSVSPSAIAAGTCPIRTVKGIRPHLRALGVFGNKHVPEMYMRAGYNQRLALLHGLMDGDGCATPLRKQCVFSNTDQRLSKQVAELLLSLGQRPLASAVDGAGFGKTVKVYPVIFRPLNGLNPFLMPRKRDRAAGWGNGYSHVRKVRSVEAIPSVPTQCIAVDSGDHSFLCTEKFLITHNTGKRKADFTQLNLFSAALFAQHPELEQIKQTYLWLKTNQHDSETMARSGVTTFWQKMLPRVQRMEYAYANDQYFEKPSGLCNGWCYHPTCQYRKGNK